MKPTLLVLAAGMGSRYGGLKQMDGLGPHGETIIDYSIHDAVEAGFGKIVYIVRDFFKADMEKARMEADMQFAALGIDEKPEDMDKVKKGVDETCDRWTKKRDQLHDEKLKEIEDAHIKWQTDQQASAQKKQEEDAAHNEDVGSSMRMNSEDE